MCAVCTCVLCAVYTRVLCAAYTCVLCAACTCVLCAVCTCSVCHAFMCSVCSSFCLDITVMLDSALKASSLPSFRVFVCEVCTCVHIRQFPPPTPSSSLPPVPCVLAFCVPSYTRVLCAHVCMCSVCHVFTSSVLCALRSCMRVIVFVRSRIKRFSRVTCVALTLCVCACRKGKVRRTKVTGAKSRV